MLEDKTILKYFGPKHDKTGSVMLNWLTIVGAMQSGKSTTIKSIIKAINEEYKERKQLNLFTMDPRTIYLLPEDIMAKVRDSEIINIFVDDAAFGASSKMYNAKHEANWFWIRHYFEEEVGLEKGTINVFYAIQRYKSLQNVLRSSPLLLWKAIPIRDPFERKEVGFLTRGKLKLIDSWAWSVYMDANLATLEKSLVVPSSGPSYIIRIPKNTTEDFIRLPGPTRTGRCGECWLAMHEGGITQEAIGQIVGHAREVINRGLKEAIELRRFGLDTLEEKKARRAMRGKRDIVIPTYNIEES